MKYFEVLCCCWEEKQLEENKKKELSLNQGLMCVSLQFENKF